MKFGQSMVMINGGTCWDSRKGKARMGTSRINKPCMSAHISELLVEISILSHEHSTIIKGELKCREDVIHSTFDPGGTINTWLSEQSEIGNGATLLFPFTILVYDPGGSHENVENLRAKSFEEREFATKVTKPQQTECVGESSSQDINNRETVRDLSRRHYVNDRLPGPVLLAKERLRERLRGVSGSEARQSRETSPSFHYDFWVFDADWETNGFQDPPTSDTILNESTSERNHQQSMSEEAKKKPLGLTKETLKKLRREVFTLHQKGGTQLKSKASNECNICLENFVEGNELVTLSCGHKFHTSCLYPWLRTCGDCPYCRARFLILS
ncbi:uncharacterized protein LOC141607787 [Silene latifolia]|uniref:uncharacterized protein LOC141607787 n=1 Tax=Silene latifolia TaxID=37657 RepID=UPI003D779F67